MERWAIDRLIPYAKNARTHSPAQIAAIAASIREWGWTSPALVGEDGGLIAGHARILAARQLGIGEIPVSAAHPRRPSGFVTAVALLDEHRALSASHDKPSLSSFRGAGCTKIYREKVTG